ncbi:MAG TPA: CBS domain-containing protein [Pseudonocardia sp.]|jgi:CBS domain-containing protein|uniref:CBS domain-containing protein n=1 Tax=Pseudonocardia sp. TaxID=60912 RepID=UPI002C7D42D7|nr:CBS domain-containing protein [Pseudonocardia sp.]HTF49024.1 CBS domain-containing protein [Pseudonocardia sp.]
MSRITDVLRSKGSDVVTISPDTLVSELLSLLVGRNIGAAVVTSDDAVVGIVSERDVVHCIYGRGAQLLATPVSDIMSTNVVTCVPEDEVDNLMRTMTERRIRHLPVVVDGSLIGIVSIGDMVKARIGELEEERAHLHSYLAAGS